jgi:NitT/TauT family transport system substrate-binding protein
MDVTRVRLGQANHGIFYAPQYVCLNLRLFEREGLDVELSTPGDGPNVADALLNRRIDIGRAGPIRTLVMADRGQHLVNIAEVTSRAGYFLLGRKAHPTFDWSSLAGASVIAPKEPAIMWACTEQVLRKQGVDPKKVHLLRDIPFEETANAFRQGLGDYVMHFQPEAEFLRVEQVARLVVDMSRAVGHIPFSSYVVTREFLAKEPETLRRFLRAFSHALRWVRTHSSREIADVLAPSFPSLDLRTLIGALDSYVQGETWPPEPILGRSGFEYLQQVVLDAGITRKLYSYGDFVDTEIAVAACEQAARSREIDRT